MSGVEKTLLGSDSKDLFTQERANVVFDILKNDAIQSAKKQLNEIILPSTKWQFFDFKKLTLSYSANYARGISRVQFPFNDEPLYTKNGDITQIRIQSGSRVDGV